MKLHRFYLEKAELPHDFWVQDERLFHQWTRVLRFQKDRELVLFNQEKHEKLYKITEIGKDAVHVEMITEMTGKSPKKEVYLCFSLLKKDKNDWVLQKGTELGVGHFIPMLCDRTEKTGFDVERAEKIVMEAAEQCGRVDIPRIRELLSPEKVVSELSGKMPIYIMEQGGVVVPKDFDQIAALIGPEGGWSDKEKQLFVDKKVQHLALSDFTLRAETAAVTAAALLQ